MVSFDSTKFEEGDFAINDNLGNCQGLLECCKKGGLWVGHGVSRAQQHIAYCIYLVEAEGHCTAGKKQDGTDAFLRSLCCSGHAES